MLKSLIVFDMKPTLSTLQIDVLLKKVMVKYSEESSLRLYLIRFILLMIMVLPFSVFSQSIVLNELSQGTSGSKEYVELIVTGPNLTNCTDTPACLDLRGYIFDDNNGYLNGGAQSGVGIASGACRFANTAFWSCIPAGTTILIYNNNDPNGAVPLDDISMTDGNCSLVIPANSTLFEHHTSAPSTSNSSYSTTGWNSGGSWTTVSLANSEDGFQIYAPSNTTTPVFSIGWGPATSLGDIYMGSSSTSGDVMYATDCNFLTQSSWTLGSASTDQTPGTANSVTQADCIGVMNHGCATPPSITISTTPETCAGTCDGDATVTVTGGTSPYTFSWSPAPTTGQGTNAISGLCSGTYNLTFTDNNGAGCVINDAATITAGGSCCSITTFTESISACNPSGGFYSIGGTVDYSGAPTTGDLTITVDDGVSTYTSTINSPFGGNDSWSITNLPANGNNLTITAVFSADNLCVQTLTDVAPLDMSIINTVNDVQCFGACDGSISVALTGGTGAIQYSFDGGNSFQTGSSINSLCSGNYDVVVQDGSGCSVSSTETISEPLVLTTTLGISSETCANDCDGSINSIPTGGTNPYTYTWSINANTGNVPLANNLCSGSYALNITDANGCFIDTTVSLTSPPAITIDNLSVTDETCFGDCTGEVAITATNGFEYSIDGVNYSTATNFTSLCGGNFTAYVRDASGCEVTSPFTVNSPGQVTVSASSDITICVDGSTTISANASGGAGNYTYTWDNGLGTGQSMSVSPSSNLTYCVIAQDQNGCQSSNDCVTVTLYDSIQLTVSPDGAICDGEFYNLSVQATGGLTGTYTYTWDQGLPNSATQTVTPTMTTTYTVTVADGCETPAVSESINVVVLSSPDASFTEGAYSVCLPAEVSFTETTPSGGTCSWDFGDGTTIPTCGDVTYTFNEAGCYDVTHTVTSVDGCMSSYTLPNQICVYDYPTPDFEYEPSIISILNSDVEFTNTSSNASAYLWYFDALGANDSSDLVDPSYTFPPISGEYLVCMEAINDFGCAADTCKVIVVNELSTIYVPNAFTPDNDGINEVFMPIVSGVEEDEYSFRIFNRWGEVVFQTSTIGEAWDGTKFGKPSQADVYIWKLTALDQITGEYIEHTGHVTLFR